ncbi:MAG TPA: hypothetical protein VFZ78_12090, partial [Flavisolibacter sp.]
MKRFIITIAIAVSFIGFSSFTGHEVSREALESFKSSFKSATEVTWTVTDEYYKASFSMNGQYITAYYRHEGELIAMTRNMSSLQLPINLQASLRQDYEKFWISELFELANNEGTTYYVTL